MVCDQFKSAQIPAPHSSSITRGPGGVAGNCELRTLTSKPMPHKKLYCYCSKENNILFPF